MTTMRDINISPLLSIFDTSPDGFFIVRDCVIEYANRVINEMAGENIEGKEVLKVFDKKLVDKVRITLTGRTHAIWMISRFSASLVRCR